MKKLAVKIYPLFVLPMLEHSIHLIFQKCLGKISFILMLFAFCSGYFLHGKAAEHSMIIKTDRSLWGFGRNDAGQLGDGTTTNRNTPTMIISSGVAQVACGHKHTLVLKTDGSLWTFGHNGHGQLGNGNTTNRSTPLQILPSGVSQVSAGYFHSLVLKTDGSLWTFGHNGYGQLGNGNTTNLSTPTQILTSGVSKIAAGGYFSLISKTDGSLWGFGTNGSGQLVDGTTTQRNTPTQSSITSLSKFSSGGENSLILKTDGSLLAVGRNDYGQLGDGTTTNRNPPTQILSGSVNNFYADLYHSFIVKEDGSLWAMGQNTKGQLGDGTTANRNTPTQILSSGVEQAVGGYYHSLILKTDGSLWSMGQNTYGQLGDGSTTNRNTPTQILSTGVASLSDVTPQSINLTTINFDDAFAEHGNGSNPATYYFGVSISGTYFGVVGGVGNGDPGNWSLAGSNGSVFLGVNTGPGSSQTFTFSSPIDYFSIDAGIKSGAANSSYSLTAFNGNTQVGNITLNVSSGTWVKGEFSSIGNFDKVTVLGLSGTNAWGLDNLKYGNQQSSANVAPIITQGEGPLTKTVDEDGTISWTPSELNATDSDTASGSLTWSVSSAASNGTAIVSGSGASPSTFTYQPNANFNGSDSFEVRVSDGNLSDTININVTVTAVNDAPVIAVGSNSLVKTVAEDSNESWNWHPTELNASDLDNNNGSLSWGVSVAPIHGVLTVTGTGSRPSNFNYLPNPNFNGPDSFELQVSDGTLTDTITINITVTPVNDAPAITQGAGPLTKTVVEDETLSWTPSELNATDLDSDVGSLVWSISSAASNGVATVSGSGASPTTFTYQPDANFNGTDSFEVQVSDGTTTDKITVNVTVTSVDDSPFTNKKLSDVNATENDPDLSIDLTGLFGDIDNEPSEIILSAESSNSSVVSVNIVQNTLILDFQNNQNGTSTISISGTSNNQKATVSFGIYVAPSKDNPLNIASVSTLSFVDGNKTGVYRLEGSILNRGLFAITDGGFLVGKGHDSKTVIRYNANLTDTKDDFFIDLNDSELDAGETYYYRAYLNIGGSEVLGGLREFTTTKPVDPNAWYAKMEDLGSGWWRSDWFGAFSVHVNGWIYHADLGWSYAVGDDQEGLWLWTSERGWLWTSEQSWPYLWQHEAANWFYFLKQEGKAGVFFDFSSGQYTE